MATVSVVIGLLVAACSSGGSDGSPVDGSSDQVVATIGPRTVDHEYGTTEVPSTPDRIVALSEEFLLADLLSLGVVPIASTSNDDSFGGLDVDATAGIENVASSDVNIEQIAALRPDLILAYPVYIELVEYDVLNAIAPGRGSPLCRSSPRTSSGCTPTTGPRSPR